MNRFRQALAKVFDDDLATYKWHNIADYAIIGMILLSTAAIFLSTFHLSPKERMIVEFIDTFTLIFFVVEVSLRLWVAPLLNPKWEGWKGRLRYCGTFYGFIDVVSTYPFLLEFIVPFPYNVLKVLRMFRVLRLFRITRYSKSFTLLSKAIKNKRQELLISLQFLIIITFILSIILYFCEHAAQPDVYKNGGISTLWAFTQYLGGPAGFMNTPPVTVLGRVIACIIGLLGIAIFAVPAGILGSGFTETMEEEKEAKKLEANGQNLRKAFTTVLDRMSRLQIVKPYLTLGHIQARLNLSEAEIIQTVNASRGFRLVNLGTTIPVGENAMDVLAVEHFPFNRPYGTFIDRGSRFTVIAPSNFIDDCTGSFFYYLALIGGFNYVSREFGVKIPSQSYYIIQGDGHYEELPAYMADIRQLLHRPGAWSMTGLVASGANEPAYREEVHFGTGNGKGDETIGDLVTDKEIFRDFYTMVADMLHKDFHIDTDCGKYHASSNPRIFLRQLNIANHNDFIMRIAWSAMLRSPDRILIAATIARCINRGILGLEDNPEVDILRQKHMGYEAL